MLFLKLTELIKTNNEKTPIREQRTFLAADTVAMITGSEMETTAGPHIIGKTKKIKITHIGTKEGRMMHCKDTAEDIMSGKLFVEMGDKNFTDNPPEQPEESAIVTP